jgi:hypothetical protein
VAQQQEFGILGCRTSRQQRKPPHHLAEHQVHQLQGHLPIICAIHPSANSQLSTHDRLSHRLHIAKIDV